MARKSVSSGTQQQMYVLEESFYPEAWRDDSRMGVLLSEFRTRNVNPENYDSKMKFWKELIQQYCDYKGSPVVSIVELKRVFKRKGTSPYCLPVVFEDMLRDGQLVDRGNFAKAPQETWTGWAVDLLVKRPLGWGFGKVKEKIVGSNLQNEDAEFVCVEVVKQHTDILETILAKESKYNVILSMENLKQITKESGLSEEALDMIIHDMSCKQRVFIERLPSEKEDKSKIIFKFAAPGSRAQPITDIERSIHNLEQTEQDLLRIVDRLEKEVTSTLAIVKENIRDGRKQLAKSNLKKKHLQEKNLEKKMNVLENVQTMLARIHDSQSDRNVIEAYKLGSNALKNAFASSGITLDSVDDTLAEMKEIMEQQDELQVMISTPQSNDIDDLELEQELADLIDLKLAENHISVQPVAPIVVPAAAAATVPGASTPTMAQLNDFDKEIEKRLAALKMDVPSPQSDTSIVGDASFRVDTPSTSAV